MNQRASEADHMNRHGPRGCDRIVRPCFMPLALPSGLLYLLSPSDYSGNHLKLKRILLNGNNVCMVRLTMSFPLPGWWPRTDIGIVDTRRRRAGGHVVAMSVVLSVEEGGCVAFSGLGGADIRKLDHFRMQYQPPLSMSPAQQDHKKAEDNHCILCRHDPNGEHYSTPSPLSNQKQIPCCLPPQTPSRVDEPQKQLSRWMNALGLNQNLFAPKTPYPQGKSRSPMPT